MRRQLFSEIKNNDFTAKTYNTNMFGFVCPNLNEDILKHGHFCKNGRIGPYRR